MTDTCILGEDRRVKENNCCFHTWYDKATQVNWQSYGYKRCHHYTDQMALPVFETDRDVVSAMIGDQLLMHGYVKYCLICWSLSQFHLYNITKPILLRLIAYHNFVSLFYYPKFHQFWCRIVHTFPEIRINNNDPSVQSNFRLFSSQLFHIATSFEFDHNFVTTRCTFQRSPKPTPP